MPYRSKQRPFRSLPPFFFIVFPGKGRARNYAVQEQDGKGRTTMGETEKRHIFSEATLGNISPDKKSARNRRM
jgi:hypothetical protein